MRGLFRGARDSAKTTRPSQSRRLDFMSFQAELAAIALLATFGVSGAELTDSNASAFRFNPLITMGLSGGGDTIAKYRGTLFGEPAEFEVDAGGDILLFGGVDLSWPRRHTGLLVQAGFFSGGPGNFEQSAEFSRVPLELIAVFHWKRFRPGVGVTHHFSPRFRDEGITNLSLDFEDATGSVLQLDYLFDRFNVGLRHVVIDYSLSDALGAPGLDGDHWGITGTLRFGERR